MNRDEVFVAGGQPTVTYVDRQEQHVERLLARAIAAPNQIVSLSGPSKTGKTVLCRKVLERREFIWVDGGKITSANGLWDFVCSEFNVPHEYQITDLNQEEVSVGLAAILTANGSQLKAETLTEVHKIDTMTSAIETMRDRKITLVIDDFHYLEQDVRTEVMRNVKGAVFSGLKVVLLSVTHRVFDAIKAENELTGRITSVTLPEWEADDLRKIPVIGLKALGAICPPPLLEVLCEECQNNPFLLQKFCWELCFDSDIDEARALRRYTIDESYDSKAMFVRIAKDAGLPIYQKLSAGPQSRKVRAGRPLKSGGEADIYQATLQAIAETGPKQTITYDELRSSLNDILSDNVPQKHEVTSALKHLTKISREIGAESAIDWDEDSREVTIADPYLRFYLRWQIKGAISA